MRKTVYSSMNRAAGGHKRRPARWHLPVRPGPLVRSACDSQQRAYGQKMEPSLVPTEQLPEQLRKMTPEAREKHVRGLLQKREEIQKQIGELAKKREAYIEQEQKKRPDAADGAFDQAVRRTLRDQAKRKGIDVPK